MKKNELLRSLRSEFDELTEKRAKGELTEADEKRLVQVSEQLEAESLRALSDQATKALEELRGAEGRIEDARSFAEQAARAKQGSGVEIELRAGDITKVPNVQEVRPTLFQELLKPLEAELVHTKLGLKIQTGVVGQPLWPVLANIEAQVLGEAEELTDKNLNITKIVATPTRSGVSVPVTYQAVNSTNLNLRSIVLERIGQSIGALLNKRLFATTAPSPNDGLQSVLATPLATPTAEYTAAAGVTFANIVALETAVRSKNVVFDDSACYVMNSKMLGVLKTTPIENGNPKMIYENGLINGYRVIETNWMPDDVVLFGVFSYAVIAQYGDGMRLWIETDGRKDLIRFTLNCDQSITVLRPEAFAALKKK